MDNIICKQEILKEAEYRLELAKWKWTQYLQNIDIGKTKNSNSENPAPKKPMNPNLTILLKMRHIDWKSLRLINIAKFNLKPCYQFKDKKLNLCHIIDCLTNGNQEDKLKSL